MSYLEDAEAREHQRQLVAAEDDRRRGTYTPHGPTDEERKERRLWREAQTNNLGVLIHKDVTDRSKATRVQCEVTYQEEGDVEHCGWWHVYVPEIDPEGLSDDEAMAAHPATLATEKLTDWVDDNREYIYFSIDDTYPA